MKKPSRAGFDELRLEFILPLLLASALVWGGCGRSPDKSIDQAPMLPTVTVGVRTVESSMKAITEEVSGTVRAARRATLEAKLSGRITELPVVAGQRVREGERMARIEAGEAVARSDQANATLEQAERDWRRLSALFEQAALTRAEYEAADTRLRMARASVAEAKSILEHAEVVAPFDGVVARKWVDVGDQAAPGRPLITVEDPSSLELEADLPVGSVLSRYRQMSFGGFPEIAAGD
jgi:RND family efflux transporter MFP subunit